MIRFRFAMAFRTDFAFAYARVIVKVIKFFPFNHLPLHSI